MKKADDWTTTYEHFLEFSDRLTTELDRFTDLMQANKAMLDRVGRYTEHVESTSIQIGAQVEQVRKAWAQAEHTAAQAAQLAHKSAFEGVRSCLNTVTEELGRSVRANTQATARIKSSHKLIYWSAAGCVLASFIAVFAAAYFAGIRSSTIDDEIRLKAARYERIMSSASKPEQARFLKLFQTPRVDDDSAR